MFSGGGRVVLLSTPPRSHLWFVDDDIPPFPSTFFSVKQSPTSSASLHLRSASFFFHFSQFVGVVGLRAKKVMRFTKIYCASFVQ